jgi:polyisoprenoid-binding protein YceI
MMQGSRSLHRPLRHAATAALVGLVAAVATTQAQTNWTVDPKSSLAWWQVNPHLGHLWATTCPEDPSWQPGAGRSAGWGGNTGLAEMREGAVYDTIHVQVYPRHRARPICGQAVQGDVSLPDTATWRGAKAHIKVTVDAMVTGEAMRDNFAHTTVLETSRYQYAEFVLDSLIGMTRRRDTLRGTAVGTVTLHGVEKRIRASIRAWPEAGGTRVEARLRVPAQELVTDFGISKYALGLGVTTGIWKDFFMGVDMVLLPKTTGAAPSGTAPKSQASADEAR